MLTHAHQVPADIKRVVILGSRGFISHHLQHWCTANKINFLAIGSKEIDLSDVDNAPRLAALLRPDDAIVMTSSLTPDKGRDYLTLMSNLRMAETVCRALNKSQCSHFVYLSSDAVYDAHQIPLDEDSSREPIDLYALCHTAREMMLGEELARNVTPLCILRLTTVYGPGDTHHSYGPNRFVRTALSEGRIELFGDGEERRSHVFIDDAVKLIGLALMHRSAGTLNVAFRPAVSFRDAAQLVMHVIGTPIRIDRAARTVPIIHRPYKPTQLFRFLYNLGRPISQVVHRTFVNSAVFKAFPDFRFTPLKDGIRAFIESERAGNIAKGTPVIKSSASGPTEPA